MEIAVPGPSESTALFHAGQPYWEDWDDTSATEPEQTDGWLTVEEVRRLCQEAIARGQAYERARAEAWKRRLKLAAALAAPALLGSAIVWCLFLIR
jgi:hypothetical protein